MRIAMLSIEYLLVVGGGERYIEELIKRLSKKKYKIDLICGRPFFGKFHVKREKGINIKVVRHPWIYPLYNKYNNFFIQTLINIFLYIPSRLIFALRCYNLIKNENYDIVQAFGFFPLIAAILYKKKKKIPIIAKFSGTPTLKLFGLTERILRKADVIVATGDTVDKFKKLFNIKTKKINPGIDINSFKPNSKRRTLFRNKYNINKRELVILFVGRLIPIKNISLQIEIVKELLEKRISLKFFIVGEGILEQQLKKRVRKYKLENKIKFTGRIPYNLLPGLYNMADIFLLTSYYEAYPIVVLEAMSSGVPVVAVDVGGLHYLIKHKKNSLLVPLNKESILKSILSLINDKKLYKTLSIEARKTIVKKYSWDKVANEYEKLYKYLYKNV